MLLSPAGGLCIKIISQSGKPLYPAWSMTNISLLGSAGRWGCRTWTKTSPGSNPVLPAPLLFLIFQLFLMVLRILSLCSSHYLDWNVCVACSRYINIPCSTTRHPWTNIVSEISFSGLKRLSLLHSWYFVARADWAD